MEVGKLQLDYVDGYAVAKYPVREIVVAQLDGVKAKLESGELDPIKGTDLDKDLLLKAIEELKKLV